MKTVKLDQSYKAYIYSFLFYTDDVTTAWSTGNTQECFYGFMPLEFKHKKSLMSTATPQNKLVRWVIYAWNMKKKKGIQQNVDMFFFNQKVMEEKEIKIQHYNFSVACYFNSQNRMLFIAPHSVWQKTQNHFPFERNWKYISRAFTANVRNITLKINIIPWKKRRQSKKINKKKINRVIRVGWMVFLKNVWKWKCQASSRVCLFVSL